VRKIVIMLCSDCSLKNTWSFSIHMFENSQSKRKIMWNYIQIPALQSKMYSTYYIDAIYNNYLFRYPPYIFRLHFSLLQELPYVVFETYCLFIIFKNHKGFNLSAYYLLSVYKFSIFTILPEQHVGVAAARRKMSTDLKTYLGRSSAYSSARIACGTH
jgi:hypothetical protein